MEKYLPLGSVVLLKDGYKEIMIYGRLQTHATTGKLYDYVACLYPEGNISPEFTFMFNHEQIREVLFVGYQSEKEAEFSKELHKIISQQQR